MQELMAKRHLEPSVYLSHHKECIWLYEEFSSALLIVEINVLICVINIKAVSRFLLLVKKICNLQTCSVIGISNLITRYMITNILVQWMKNYHLVSHKLQNKFMSYNINGFNCTDWAYSFQRFLSFAKSCM